MSMLVFNACSSQADMLKVEVIQFAIVKLWTYSVDVLKNLPFWWIIYFPSLLKSFSLLCKVHQILATLFSYLQNISLSIYFRKHVYLSTKYRLCLSTKYLSLFLPVCLYNMYISIYLRLSVFLPFLYKISFRMSVDTKYRSICLLVLNVNQIFV